MPQKALKTSDYVREELERGWQMGKAPTLLQDDQLVYTCQFVKEGDGKAFITNVETQEIIELERRSTMPPNLQT